MSNMWETRDSHVSGRFVSLLLLLLAALLLLTLSQLGSAAVIVHSPYYDPAADEANMQYYYGNMDPPMLASYARLHELISSTHHREYHYDTSRKQFLYPRVDIQPDGTLRGIYTNRTFTGPGDYNCEHTVPQSFFDRKEPMRGDMHHLFAADMRCNSFRSNYMYIDMTAKVPLKAHKEMPGCGRLLVQQANSRMSLMERVFFEPMSDAAKAAVSRAFLYFLVRHRGTISRNLVTDHSLNVMRRWAAKGPVTLWEKHRNAEIYEIQGNRNPFIDKPDLALSVNFEEAFRYP